MSLLLTLFSVIVLLIGLFMISKHYKKGFTVPPVLSGVAFALIGLSNLISLI